MQTQGSLQESSLASLLQTMQTERATGALSIENASENASLYFLFGHLFHAAGPGGQGEDVVINALAWEQGNFRFDPRAKLPPEETIKASPSDLISEADRRAPAAGGQQAASGESEAGWTPSANFGVPAEATAASGPAQFETSSYPQQQPAEEFPAPAWATQPEYGSAYPAEPAAGLEQTPAAADSGFAAPWGQPTPETPRHDGAAYEAQTPAYEAPSGNSYQPQATSPGAYEPPVQTYDTSASQQTPNAGTSGSAGQVLGAPGAEELHILYPLPSGKSQYEGLKSAFVDFPKLLRTLRGDQHTGYVRLTSPNFSGVLLFQQGQLLQALSSDTPGGGADEAFLAVRRQMDAGTGTIDVIDLSADTVNALAHLLTAPLMYTGLLGRFVNFEALLEHLSEEKVEGAIVVIGVDDIGIILLNQGTLLGAYTRSDPTLETVPVGVAKIAAENTARIEVKSGTGSVAAIDVENALSRPY